MKSTPLRIYTRIDELPEWLLDILARDFAVDWYDRSYTLEEKKNHQGQLLCSPAPWHKSGC